MLFLFIAVVSAGSWSWSSHQGWNNWTQSNDPPIDILCKPYQCECIRFRDAYRCPNTNRSFVWFDGVFIGGYRSLELVLFDINTTVDVFVNVNLDAVPWPSNEQKADLTIYLDGNKLLHFNEKSGYQKIKQNYNLYVSKLNLTLWYIFLPDPSLTTTNMYLYTLSIDLFW